MMRLRSPFLFFVLLPAPSFFLPSFFPPHVCPLHLGLSMRMCIRLGEGGSHGSFWASLPGAVASLISNRRACP